MLKVIATGLNADVIFADLTQTGHQLIDTLLCFLRLVLLSQLQLFAVLRLLGQLLLSGAKFLLQAFDLALSLPPCFSLRKVALVFERLLRSQDVV